MNRFFLIGSFILLFQFPSEAQFEENFEFSLDSWLGNVENFIINSDHQLQLNAPEAGNSNLYQSVQYTDSMVFELYLNLDFAPSANNKLRWYLWAEENTMDDSNAYYLEIGENGSDDLIYFYSRKNGAESILGKGKLGKVSDSPKIFVKVVLLSGQHWEVLVDYNGTRFPQSEFSFEEKVAFTDTEGYHGISLFYTSSRTTDFIFDDWMAGRFQDDVIPPSLLAFEVQNEESILLSFDEPILESSINLSNFKIRPFPAIASNFSLNNNLLLLTFDGLPKGELFTLIFSGISDLQGNILDEVEVEDLLYAPPPTLGELVISEILFNPKGNGSDYVELYNITSKYINISEVEVHNLDNGQAHAIGQNLIIFPGEFIALSEDATETIVSYMPPDSSSIFETQLPSFNNDEGNVSIFYQGIILDSFDYNEDLHNPIINDPDGVSLERLNLSQKTNTPSNWTSAASTTNYGTPGYKNSASIEFGTSSAEFSLRSSSFSPNNDGLNDQLILDYDLNKSGYIATVDIYNEKGNLIKKIVNNSILSTRGYLTWDGFDDENLPARIGIYIVVVNLFHSDGDTKMHKLAASLNRQTK